jgi:hypothetical protein
LESLKEGNPSEDLGIDGRILLKCILRKDDWIVWIGLIRLLMETSSGFCERGYELSSSLKGGISRMPDRRPFFY